jgi:hypothetical protein
MCLIHLKNMKISFVNQMGEDDQLVLYCWCVLVKYYA